MNTGTSSRPTAKVSRLYRMVRMGFSEVSTSRKPKMNGRMYVASKTAVSRRATIEALASLARRPLPFRAVATMPLPTSPYRRAMVRKLSVASRSEEPSS